MRDVVDDNGHEEAGDGPDAVGQAHQDRGVARRDVEVVDVVARYSEPAARHSEGHLYRSHVLKKNNGSYLF